MATPPFLRTHPRACALVLASTKGSRLFPLTTPETPKHLLPVGGTPCIIRLVESLSTSFGQIVVAIAAEDDATPKAIGSIATPLGGGGDEGAPSGTWEFVTSGDGAGRSRSGRRVSVIRLAEDCFGPVHAIRRVEEAALVHPSSRLVVFPGDIVFLKSGHDFGPLVRPGGDDSSCVVMLVDVGEVDESGAPMKESAKAKKGGLSRDDEDIDYVALCHPASEPAGGRRVAAPSLPLVVLKKSKLDVEEDEDMTGSTAKLEIPRARVRHGRVVVRVDWNDVHVYSFAAWQRRLIGARKDLTSIQEHVLPLLIDRQFRGKGAAFGRFLEDPDRGDGIGKEDPSETVDGLDGGYSVLADVQPARTALRANTIPSYLFACKEVVANGASLTMPPNSKRNDKFQSLTLEGATIGAKITMRSSTIGKRGKLGSKCRLNSVVIMDDVVIGDNCSLQNTVIGPGAKLGNNCSLTDCQVGPGTQIPAMTKEKGEVFMAGDVHADEML